MSIQWHGRLLAAGLLAAGLTVQAQDANRATPASRDGQRTGQGMSDRARQRFIKEIRNELVTLPFYGVFENLSFRIDGGTVTLLGQVTRPTLKSSAERVVKDVEGVERVVNNIEVLPLSPNDDRIRRDMYRAIFSHNTLNRYALQAVPPIHIIVKNGNVTLEGVVANEMDKNVANIVARGVPGVFNVTNNLRTDAEMRMPL